MRKGIKMRFAKYHGLGNDYIVLDPQHWPAVPTEKQIKTICHRNFGIGSDGILYGPMEGKETDFGLRIFNPDGSEAEKSGNGLRIFVRYLWDQGLIAEKPVKIWTLGGNVNAEVKNDGQEIKVAMGQVSFQSKDIPVMGTDRDVINETIQVGGERIVFSAATIGNPHCVVTEGEVSSERACRIGPLLEKYELFPNKTNVQFLRVVNRAAIQIEIWERGAGYTLASGSSSVASAAVAKKLGLCDNHITVHMPGGNLSIEFNENYDAMMTGPVTAIAAGQIHREVLE